VSCGTPPTSEVAFTRVTFTTMGLRDSIPRSFFPIMGDMNDRGHAYINLCAPFCHPGNALPDYFDSPKAGGGGGGGGIKVKSEYKVQTGGGGGGGGGGAPWALTCPPS
jgi:hypothetical protein